MIFKIVVLGACASESYIFSGFNTKKLTMRDLLKLYMKHRSSNSCKAQYYQTYSTVSIAKKKKKKKNDQSYFEFQLTQVTFLSCSNGHVALFDKSVLKKVT